MISSPFPDIEIPDIALTPFVLRNAAELGDTPALIDGPTGRTITYAGLLEATKLTAGGLRARGFEKGDVLGVMSPNIPEYAVAFHGAAWAGGAATTINPTYTAEEVHHQLLDSGATFLITVSMFLATAKEAAESTKVKEIFVFDDAEGATSALELLAGPRLDEQVPVDPAQDLVVLPYSSGTTGRSKGVVLTHRNCVANLIQTTESCIELTRDDSFVAVLPFFHIYGMQVLMNLGLANGATIITMPRFDLPQFLQLNQDHRCTWAFVVPPIVLALAQHPIVDDYDLSCAASSLLRRGAARCRDLRPGREAHRRRRGAGLRHDRAEPGEPCLPRGADRQARIGRSHHRQHRVPHRRRGHPAPTCPSASGASCGCADRR